MGGASAVKRYVNPKYNGRRSKVTRTSATQREQRQAIDRSVMACATRQAVDVRQSMPW